MRQLQYINPFNSGLGGQEGVGFMGNVVLILRNAANNKLTSQWQKYVIIYYIKGVCGFHLYSTLKCIK